MLDKLVSKSSKKKKSTAKSSAITPDTPGKNAIVDTLSIDSKIGPILRSTLSEFITISKAVAQTSQLFQRQNSLGSLNLGNSLLSQLPESRTNASMFKSIFAPKKEQNSICYKHFSDNMTQIISTFNHFPSIKNKMGDCVWKVAGDISRLLLLAMNSSYSNTDSYVKLEQTSKSLQEHSIFNFGKTDNLSYSSGISFAPPRQTQHFVPLGLRNNDPCNFSCY